MLCKLLLAALLAGAALAADSTIKSDGSNIMVTADGVVTMKADGGSTVTVGNDDISMTAAEDSTTTMKFSEIIAAITDMQTKNTDLSQLLADLTQNYTDLSTEVANTKSAYATANADYVTTLQGYINNFNTFSTGTLTSYRTQLTTQIANYNSSGDANGQVVAGLIAQYTQLKDARQFSQKQADTAINTAVKTAEDAVIDAKSKCNAYTNDATAQGNSRQAKIDAAKAVLTGTTNTCQGKITTATASVSSAGDDVKDLAKAINAKLTPALVSSVNTETAKLQANVDALMAALEPTYFKLEDSVQRLRSVINDDFDKYEEVPFAPTTIDAADYLGEQADADGDTVIVGARFWSQKSPVNTRIRPGAAYIITFNTTSRQWMQDALLIGPSRTTILTYFGSAVSISGDTAIVGEWGARPRVGRSTLFSAGAAHIYKKKDGTWTKTQVLIAPDAGAYDYFGRAVHIDGNRLIVSAPYHDQPTVNGVSGNSKGILYVYERASADGDFAFVTVLSPPGSAAGDALGNDATSISIRGDWIVASATFAEEGTGEFSHGHAYIWQYRRPIAPKTGPAAWQYLTDLKRTGDDADSYDLLGATSRICLKNGRPIVALGSTGDDLNATHGTSTGAVILFRLTNQGRWEMTTLRDPSATSSLFFGYNIAFDASCSRMVVSARGADSYKGGLYEYSVLDNGVSLLQKFVPGQAKAYDYVGSGLTVGSDFIGAGAWGDDTKGSSAGNYWAYTQSQIV